MSAAVVHWRGEPRPRRSSTPPRWERDDGPMSLAGVDGSFSVDVEVGGERWVATDRYASRPVFLARGPSATWSAAENLRSLALERPSLDPIAWAQWLCFGYIPSERTLFSGVRRLGPGSWFSLRTGERRRYWRWASAPNEDALASEEPLSTIDALEQAAVASAPADPRDVVLLSGGIDSRALLLRLQSLGRPIGAVSLGPEGDLDILRARELCRDQGVRHDVIDVTHAGGLRAFCAWSRQVTDLSDNAFVTLPMGPSALGELADATLWLGTDSFSTVLPERDPVVSEGLMGLVRGAVASRTVTPDVFAHAGLASAEGLEVIQRGFGEVLAFVREAYAEVPTWDAAFDRISHETRFRVWNINRGLLERVARCVHTPFHDVDLVETYASLPVSRRAQRRVHLAANRARFPGFERVPLHQRTLADAHVRHLRENRAFQDEVWDAIEAVPEARALLDPLIRGLRGRIETAHPLVLALLLRAGLACGHFLSALETGPS